MSCISVNVERKDGAWCMGVRESGVTVLSSRQGGVGMSTNRMDRIDLNISLFCEIGQGLYLLVRPVETQWITIDVSADYNVATNTNWNLT